MEDHRDKLINGKIRSPSATNQHAKLVDGGFFRSLLVLLSQKVAGDCHRESVIEGDSQFSM